MEYASKAYLNAMAEHIRGESYVRVYLGVINQKAQTSAYITSEYHGSETGLYDKSQSAGVTSIEADGHITFEFHGHSSIDVRGLTLTFLDTPPEAITVANDDHENTFIVNIEDGKFTLDAAFNECSFITITPSSGDLSLLKILFGIGMQFDNNDLISTQRSNTIKHLDDELPVKKFTFTVHNYKGLWNKDNPMSNAQYLQEKQEVSWDYQRKLLDGSIYTIPGGKVLLNTWSSNDEEAKFSCVGYLDYMEDTYYKGRYYPDGITLYDLAVNVLEDAGIEKYHLDGQLRKTTVYNPLPVTTHKACLQLIANAGRSILYEDRDGYLSIRPADRPSAISDADFLYGTDYSDGSAVVNPTTSDNYVSTEPGYVTVGTGMSFPPEDIADGPYLPVGFVSAEYANANGGFTNNPQINVRMQSAFTLHQIALNCRVAPRNMMLRLTYEGEEVYKIFSDNIDNAPVFDFEPITCDAVELIFTSTRPYQRIHVNSIELNGDIQYTIVYRDLNEDTPLASSLDKVSMLNVHVYDYSYGTAEHSAIVSASQGLNTIQMTSPCSDYSAVYADGEYAGEEVPIRESGAYYIVLEAPYDGNVSISAYEYTVTDRQISTQLYEDGTTVESKNPLISTTEHAQACESWMENHYMNDVEYELNFRGDPILDADDTVYLENRFVRDNLIRIESENLSTSVGMEPSNRIIARRVSYTVVPVVGTAVVGYFKAG